MHGAVVHLLGSARVHHKSTSHGIERVGDDTGGNGNELSESPHGEHVGFLGIWEENGLTSIEHTEVRSTVSDDTDDGDSETSVETLRTVLREDLLQAVNETVELTITALADISGETSSGEIQRVDDSEGGGTSGTAGHAVSDEELDWLLLGVVRVEDGLVEVLEGEVQSLRGEVPDDVGEVASPEGGKALLLIDSGEAVTDTVVPVLSLDRGGGVLDLEKELDSLNGGDDGLGDSSRDTTDHEIGHEALFLGRRGHLASELVLIELYFNYKSN